MFAFPAWLGFADHLLKVSKNGKAKVSIRFEVDLFVLYPTCLDIRVVKLEIENCSIYPAGDLRTMKRDQQETDIKAMMVSQRLSPRRCVSRCANTCMPAKHRRIPVADALTLVYFQCLLATLKATKHMTTHGLFPPRRVQHGAIFQPKCLPVELSKLAISLHDWSRIVDFRYPRSDLS